MTPSELRVRRVSHRGHVVEWVLNPLWVRLDQKATPNSASSGSIWSRAAAGSRSAAFWGRTKRQAFAKALLAALQAAKRGIDLQSQSTLDGLSEIGWFGPRMTP